MPYSKLSELPEQIQGYPKRAKQIWMDAFNKANAKGWPEKRCFKYAWGAVKNAFGVKGAGPE